MLAGVWARSVTNRNALREQQYQAILAERSRLARELHDTLEQGLAGVKLQLEAVAGSLARSPDAARSSLDVAREMLRYCLDEARRSVMDLRSRALEKGGTRQRARGTGPPDDRRHALESGGPGRRVSSAGSTGPRSTTCSGSASRPSRTR